MRGWLNGWIETIRIYLDRDAYRAIREAQADIDNPDAWVEVERP